MTRTRTVVMALLAGLVLTPGVSAQAQTDDAAHPDEATHAHDARMAWWRDAKFGLFIHWGLYSELEGSWNGQDWHAEWIRTTGRIPRDEYATLIGEFNPVEFDADEWARIAADAGMKYIVITSKHHDGFCLFDSARTEFDVMSTPFQRDIMAELADATRGRGLEIGWYHSIMDWNHPDYLPRRDWEAEDRPPAGADFEGRFVPYVRAQVRELLTNYGDIGVMWFDGEWEDTWTKELGNALYDECRAIQPDVIVNNRVSKGRNGSMEGLSAEGDFAGDFGTPEQQVPATGLPGVDWESCITMNNHWGWNRADRNWKSTEDMIRMLCDIASKGGNLLLNVGPRPDGTFPPEAVERLAGIGDWMEVNGESIYGTTAGPFADLGWGRCTRKDTAGGTELFFQIFDTETPGRRFIPGLHSPVSSVRALGEGAANIKLRREDGGYSFDIADLANKWTEVPTVPVIALSIKGEPVVYNPPVLEAQSGVFVESAAVRVEMVTSGGDSDAVVRYSLDGTIPTGDSPIADGSIVVLSDASITAAVFADGVRVSPPSRLELTRAEPERSSDADLMLDFEGLPRGLRRETYEGDFTRLPDFGAMRTTQVDSVESLSIHGDRERIARRYTGWIRIDEPGVYRFALTSDDGARLLINDRLVVDNDGLHVATTKTGERALAPGWHRITVEWFNRTGGATLELGFGGAGEEATPLGADRLRHRE